MSAENDKPDISVLKIKRDSNNEFTGNNSGRRRWVVPLLIVVIVLAVVLTVVVYKFDTSLEVQVTTVTTVSPSQARTILNASGYIVAQRKAAVASKATGRLMYLGVEEGDLVKKDQIIARIESEDVQAQLNQAKANYAYAKASRAQAQAELNDASTNFERQKKMLKDDLVSKTEYDTAEARYKSAAAGVDAAKENIKAMEAAVQATQVAVESTNIRAPFDGTVLNKYADVGEMVAPYAAGANAKASVVTLADMQSLEVETDVSESSIESVKPGMPCEIILDAYPDQIYHGFVHKIVPTADRSKATVLTRVRFKDLDGRVLPEMSARVSFLSEQAGNMDTKSKIAVYTAAIATRDKKKLVFRIKDSKTEIVSIVTGDAIGDYTEIISGLTAGDKVVLNPPANLTNGHKITIKQ